MQQDQTMNKMGTAKINRLMLTMGLPIILSMMLQALYNIVDSAFVSNMAAGGETALTALTLAFPVPVSVQMRCCRVRSARAMRKKSTAFPAMPSFSPQSCT